MAEVAGSDQERTEGRSRGPGRALAASCLVLALGLAAGCGASGSGATAGLEGRTWLLDADRSGLPLTERQAVTIHFDDGHAGGQMVCNSYGAPYRLDGDRLRFHGDVISTSAGCGSEAVHTALEGSLRAGVDVMVEDDTLTLVGDEHTLVFTAVDGDPEIGQDHLAGTWRVAPPDGGDATATTLTFDHEGRYEVDVGCHRYHGQLTVEEGTISAPEMGASIEEPSACTPEEQSLIALAVGGQHLRVDGQGDGLEVLDVRGHHVVTLRPTG